ncbi:MFS transporter [Enterocloster lavalensis]|uniref:MFS transporter n=1 Tax=Enterocloster lavalensis TaxID=460384 RepID=UPI0023EF6A9B|nr:MFS transporter [Enterocloster lavalensis]
MEKSFKKYLLFWFGGSVSQLGSAMTSFALILWTYTQTKSAMAVSLMSFCNYLPYILVSLFAGGFVDRHRKKTIMLAADSIAAICSFFVLLCWRSGELKIQYIYAVNCVIGFMNSFQIPAQSVAVGILVPKDKIARMSGMDSFSTNLVSVVSPVLASSIFAFGGLGAVIAADLLSFLFNFALLLIFIKIPEELSKAPRGASVLSGCFDGFRFLFRHKGLWYIIVTMAVLNFFSRLTYENILSPMILARSGGNSLVLGAVNMVLGAGGILGGLIISLRPFKFSSVKLIYFSAGASFLLGDLMMGLGKNAVWWSLAAVWASLPIPFLAAGQRMILYQMVPRELQGSVFSVRNAIQYCTIPAGLLLGGYLADFVFEPFMQSGSGASAALGQLVGLGNGSGMAVMFLCTGVLGAAFSLMAYQKKEIQDLEKSGL